MDTSRPLTIHLDTFEGPMSLLLYLIKKEEIDIYNIPIHEITKQYLEYIQIMKELNLEVAGEFVAMAATLIYIKSRMLVPQYDEFGNEIQEDPRKELVQKLLEYQRYQEAGKQLYKRPLLNRDIWLRGVKEVLPKADEEIVLDEGGLFSLISAFRKLQKKTKDQPHQVHARGMSIAARLLQIKDKFVVGVRVTFEEILGKEFTKNELLVTFLSVLELSRLGYTKVYQTDPYSAIYIDTVRAVSADDIVNRVQEFDNVDAAKAAEKLLIDAEGSLQNMSLSNFAESQINIEELNNDTEVLGVESGELT
ncbi:MAG: segregation/condensation protein A [Oligoflexia bacterium]|nr:segregation/condensation protein A [Oligoflexia bacterium]